MSALELEHCKHAPRCVSTGVFCTPNNLAVMLSDAAGHVIGDAHITELRFVY